jgi:hypothetical protein
MSATAKGSVIDALKRHWPEYSMEAFGLGLFMLSACSFGVLLEHRASPVHLAIPGAFTRRVLMVGKSRLVPHPPRIQATLNVTL